MDDGDTSNLRQFKQRITSYKRQLDCSYGNQLDLIESRKTATSKKLRKTEAVSSDEEQSAMFNLSSQTKLDHSFFDEDCSTLSQKLLGCELVRKLKDDSLVAGRIVETEAYLGGDDKASHSCGNKATERNRAMFMAPGTAYVYQIYGIHFCFNISSRGDGAAVLVRALQPTYGIDHMTELRLNGKQKNKRNTAVEKLCNGPAKLCQALAIDKTINCLDLCQSNEIWIQPKPQDKQLELVSAKRIGVEYAGNYWASQPLRFYIKDNVCVSVTVKK